jgi:hypothetical protein
MADTLIHHNLAGVIEYVGSHSQKISPKKILCQVFHADNLTHYSVVLIKRKSPHSWRLVLRVKTGLF